MQPLSTDTHSLVLANSRCVYEAVDLPLIGLQIRVDRICCGARDVAHDGALLSNQSIQERGLPGVGPAADGNANCTVARLWRIVLAPLAHGEETVATSIDHLVHDLPDASSMKRADWVWLSESKTPEVHGVYVHHLEAITLGHRHDHLQPERYVGLFQVLRDGHVVLCHTYGAVDDEDGRDGLPESHVYLQLHLLFECDCVQIVVENEASCVNDLEEIRILEVVRVLRALVGSIPRHTLFIKDDAAVDVWDVADAVHEL
mmetsp:Transcript_8564/g.18686  ORF Transcript_8564/g.18686 Transcript_8564/m.18686 type:complete len:259 (-) Transcript_8564:754-1530(-)